MKLAKQIAQALEADACLMTVGAEKIIEKKLEPIREALKSIAIIVECEGIKISVDGEYECSPKMALTEIAIEAKHALAMLEEEK